jgi:hypothetical protein
MMSPFNLSKIQRLDGKELFFFRSSATNSHMQRLRRLLPLGLALLCFLFALWTLPAAWCRRGAGEWFRGDLDTQLSLARTVAAQVEANLTTANYKTGSSLFDGEWLFGTHLMAGIGFCQIVLQHPETRAELTPRIEDCIRQLLSEHVKEFDRASWSEDPIKSLDQPRGHAAYLGYMNFLLSLYREVNPSNEFAALNDQITNVLARRLALSPSGLIATYPNEWYPVDNAPVLASIAMNQKTTGHDYSALLTREEQIYRLRYIDPHSGLLIQAANAQGDPSDYARGSGSALGVFFIHHAFPGLGKEIFGGIKRNLGSGLLGFGAIREYPHGQTGPSDIDSGPVLFGFGFSATGFTISAARAYSDPSLYARLYSSAVFAGAPSYHSDRMDFLTGGALGNAILLAMLTTEPIL